MDEQVVLIRCYWPINWYTSSRIFLSVNFPCSASTGEMKHYMTPIEINGLAILDPLVKRMISNLCSHGSLK